VFVHRQPVAHASGSDGRAGGGIEARPEFRPDTRNKVRPADFCPRRVLQFPHNPSVAWKRPRRDSESRPASQEGEAVLTFFPRIQSSTPGAFFVAAGAQPAPGYRLKQVRGRGGFAEVWEADSPTGPVALKFMISANTTTTAREPRSLQS